MKIRFLRPLTVATDERPDGEHVEAGDEFEMDDERALYYVGAKAAKALDGPHVQAAEKAAPKAEAKPPGPTRRVRGQRPANAPK